MNSFRLEARDLPSADIKQVLQLENLRVVDEPFTNGAVALVIPAENQEGGKVALRMPKLGAGEQFNEEVENRQAADRLVGKPAEAVKDHMPNLISVGKNPRYLIVQWVEGESLPKAVFGFNTQQAIRLTEQLIRYAAGWHALGRTLNDIEPAKHDPFIKCDRFVITDTKTASWVDLDANTMTRLSEHDRVELLLQENRAKTDAYTQYHDIASISGQPGISDLITIFNGTYFSPDVEAEIRNKSKKAASRLAYSRRRGVQRLLEQPANPKQQDDARREVEPQIRETVMAARTNAIQGIKEQVQQIKASLPESLNEKKLAELAESRPDEDICRELNSDQATITRISRLLSVPEDEIESTIALMLEENEIMYEPQISRSRLIQKRAYIQHLLNIMCGPMKLHPTKIEFSNNPLNDIKRILDTIDTLPDVVVSQYTQKAIRDDYLMLSTIVANVIATTNAQKGLAASIESRLHTTINSQTADRDLSKNIWLSLQEDLFDIKSKIT